MSGIKETRELLTRYSVARIPFVALHTIERARSLSLLKDVSVDLGLHFLVHTLSKGTYDIETDQIVNEDKSVYGAIDYVSEEMKHRQNLTLVLTEVPDISSDNDNAKQILDLVTLANESGGMVIALTTNSVWSQLQRLGMALTLDLPDENEMYDIISEYINDYRNEIAIEWDDDDVHEAAASLVGVTKIETENVIASLIAKKEIKKEDINEVRRAKDRLFTNISGLEKIKVNDSVRDVGGLSGLQNWLEAKQKLLTPAKHAELRQRGLRPPRGILLVGVPGCGKSLSAKSIAYNWNLPLYRLDFATVQGSYVGQTEQQLKDALNTADQVSPCVLWIDEIEKGLSGASSSNDGGVSTRMVGQFLFWLQESQKQVFVVATANDVSKLPSELLRRGRFDELFFVDLPTAEERRDIIAIYMKKYLKVNFDGPFADKVVELSTGFTGADLESTVRDLAYATLSDDSPLDEDLVTKTFQNVVPLSQTSPEKIDQIREWGKSRAVPASGKPIGAEGNLAQTNVNRTRKVLL